MSGKGGQNAQHPEQGTFNFIATATRKYGNDRLFLIQTVFIQEVWIRYELRDGVKYGIANIINLLIKLLVEVFFERKDDKHPVYKPFDFFCPLYVPCPDFWGNVEKHFYPHFAGKSRHPHVKPTVVNQN